MKSIFGLLCVATALGIIAGCQTPYSTGLQSSLGATGTSSTTSVVLTELPGRLILAGTYDVQEGALTVKLRDPGGDYPFDQTYTAVSVGQIAIDLQPVLGEWALLISSPGGTGSYNVRLGY